MLQPGPCALADPGNKNAGVPMGFVCNNDSEAAVWSRALRKATKPQPAAVAAAAGAAPVTTHQMWTAIAPDGSDHLGLWCKQVPVAAVAAALPVAAAVAAPAAAAPPPPPPPQMQQLQLACPPGGTAGMAISFMASGRQLTAQIPAGVVRPSPATIMHVHACAAVCAMCAPAALHRCCLLYACSCACAGVLCCSLCRPRTGEPMTSISHLQSSSS